MAHVIFTWGLHNPGTTTSRLGSKVQTQGTRNLKPHLPKWTMTLTSAAITHREQFLRYDDFSAQQNNQLCGTRNSSTSQIPGVTATQTSPFHLLKQDSLELMDAMKPLKYNSLAAHRQLIPKCLLGQGGDTDPWISSHWGRRKKSPGLR